MKDHTSSNTGNLTGKKKTARSKCQDQERVNAGNILWKITISSCKC